MKAIILKPGRVAQVKDIDPSYNNLRSLVGGYIEMTYPFPDEEIAVISNEEAKLLDLAPNRAIRSAGGNVLDIYCGTMVVIALTLEGEYRDLTAEEIDLVLATWEPPETKADWRGAKPNTTVRVFAGMMGGAFA